MFQAPAAAPVTLRRCWLRVTAVLTCIALACSPSMAQAHGISEASKQTMAEGGLLAYIWLGAEHMLTGYDHLLFLFGVLFFLTSFRDVLRFITAFTLGHCITLLGATLLGITANAYLVDAVIALSVIYKGFENLDGFEKTFSIKAPNLLAMVFGFGLIHGFGLSTRLQELPLGDEGLIGRILAFNVGVELGQVAALTVMIGLFAAWRASKSFETFSTAANTALVLAGLGLFVFQITGYIQGDPHDDHHGEIHESHDDHGHEHGSGHHERGDGEDHHAPSDRGASDAGAPEAQNLKPEAGSAAKRDTSAHDAAPIKPAKRRAKHGHDHGPGGHHHGKKARSKKPHKHKHKKHRHKHRHGKGPAHSH